MGWGFKGPFDFVAKDGRVTHLPTVSPSRVDRPFAEDVRQTIIPCDVTCLFMQSNLSEADVLSNDGLFSQPLLNLHQRFGYKSSLVLQQIVTDGLFTDAGMACLAHGVDPVCLDRGTAQGSGFRRCYTCPAIEGRAVAALGQELFDSQIAEGSRS